ncbi:GntR family transcriptional regulator [Paracoccus sp. (in: a-proteobacteria)]|uniref:GntR family transcriptional regulator n=1 Tax=Paracoccus sp. TaxID=267 RepID=UPI003A885E62
MGERAEQLDPVIEQIAAAIDPSCSVPVSVQLRGAIEFGIASGDLNAGYRLPSIRILARRLGVSPVTVSGVYATLQAADHIEGRAGSGTFVRSSGVSGGAGLRQKLALIDGRIAELIALGRECGLSAADLSLRMTMARPARSAAVSLLMVGNFIEATRAYASDLRGHLRAGDRIDAITLPDVDARGTAGCDLIVAPRTLLARIRQIAPRTDAVGITLIPDEATRVALATLRPDARVVGYSYFPGFVTVMKTGIRRFAPHVPDLTMLVRGDADEAAAIASADVLIHATGAGYLCDSLRPDQTAFEYRHTPDAQSVRDDLLPAIEAVRRRIPPERDAAE